MSKLIVYQDNEKIVLIDGTTIEIDTGMFNDPLGFIVTEAAEQSVERTPVDIGDGVMVDPLILGAILD